MAVKSDKIARLRSAFVGSMQGNVAVFFALTLIPVVGLVGAAVDYSKATQAQTKLQAALDTAILAGVTQPATSAVNTASNVFSAHAAITFASGVTASFTLNSDGSLSGTAAAASPTSFMSMFHVKSIGLSATSKAMSGTTGTPVCVLLVDPSASQSLLVNSGATVNAPTCEIDVRSTGSSALMMNTKLGVKKICVKGTSVTENGGPYNVVQTGCSAISDPFAGTLPTVTVGSCTYSNQTYNGSTVTLSPGVYCGSTNFNGSPTITFNPGLYVVSGGTMTINSGATINGSGVTFFFADMNSKIQFNGGITANLSAPTSGTYSGILMFEPTGLGLSQLIFNTTNGENLKGLIYLPSREVTYNASSNVSSEQITMVFDTLTLDQLDWSFTAGTMTMQNTAGGSASPYLVN